jgi:hypothetical protein
MGHGAGADSNHASSPAMVAAEIHAAVGEDIDPADGKAPLKAIDDRQERRNPNVTCTFRGLRHTGIFG